MIANKKTPLLLLALCLAGIVASVCFGIWPTRSAQIPLRFWAASFSPEGNLLVTGGGQSHPNETPQLGEVVLWNLAKGKQKWSISHPSTVRSIAWSANGKFVAIGDFGGSSCLLDPATGKTIVNLPPHKGGVEGGVNAVTVSADSELVAVGSFDGTVTLWETAGKERDPITLPAGEKVFSVALSADHGALVAGGCHGNAYLYDLNGRNRPRTLQTSQGIPLEQARVEVVAFAPDGLKLATGCHQTLRLWETASGRLVRELGGRSANLNAAVFSPRGEAVATVDTTGSLTLWNTETGDFVKSVLAHSGESFGIAFSSDGSRIATVGRTDFAVKIWKAQTLELLSTLYRAKVSPARGKP